MRNKYAQSKCPIITPNQITFLRFILTVVLSIVWLNFSLSFMQKTIICVVFSTIFILDNVDGIIARKYSLTSLSGHYFDAAVDVITYFFLALILHDEGILPLYFVALMLTREVLVVYIKAYISETGKHVATSPLSVIKCELIGVPLALLYVIFSGGMFTQYVFISMILVYFSTIRLWYSITLKQQVLLLATAILPLSLYPVFGAHISVGDWYLYSYITIALTFSLINLCFTV